jgi:peptidoglycan LD-endopeptidase LytH
MWATSAVWTLTAVLAGCACDATSMPSSATAGVAPRPTSATTVSTTTTTSDAPATTTSTSDAPVTTSTTVTPTTTTVPTPVYVFPFSGREVSYGTTHHDYPAVDVFGCGADVLAPTSGSVVEVGLVDRWDPSVDDPATRGGIFVSMLGDDGVRYYVAHLASTTVTPDETVEAGSRLGVMGQTGNARNSACHTHLGISWPCPGGEWQVRRGEIWPAPYLDAWRTGEQRSPATDVAALAAELPNACADALALVGGAP